jgi:quinolinate synthase
MLLWQGSCIVHDEFKAFELSELMKSHPQAMVLVHPESPEAVIKLADVVGSTTQIIRAAQSLNANEFIVATDKGIFHKLKAAAPGKLFIEAPTAGNSASCKSCAHCPWMAMNGLSNLADVLASGRNEVIVDPDISRQAKRSIERMLEFAKGLDLAKVPVKNFPGSAGGIGPA